MYKLLLAGQQIPGIYYPLQLKKISEPGFSKIKKIIKFLSKRKVLVTLVNFPNDYYVKLSLEEALQAYRMNKETRFKINQKIQELNDGRK